MLTTKQKKYITENHGNFSLKKIAKTLNVDYHIIKEYVSSLPSRKTPISFYLILIVIPFFIIIVSEGILRIVGYGNDYQEWISLDNNYEILNPDIASKYFNNIKNIPYSTESFLLKNKPKNSYRIIALGASSGAGYPYQNSGSFTKYLRKSFEYSRPNKKIEIANISMAAINSYTIRDLLPNLLKKQPDLIIMYLGHNEYYGALGVASMQSFSSSKFFTKIILWLKQFRVYQLIDNIIRLLFSSSTSNDAHNKKTLMAQVVKEKLIEYDSELYYKGIKQFESNLREIFELCKEKNVEIVIGTLVSNLKDLNPFEPIENNKYGSSKLNFLKGKTELLKNNLVIADSLFRIAKDLDGLRFRAPEEFNNVINDVSKEFNFSVVNIDSAFCSNSKYGIVGNELMVDHLHPNIEGYQIIGQQFFNEIINNFFQSEQSLIKNSELDSLVKLNYHFTTYDSIISSYRIKILKNDWPFNKSSKPLQRSKLLNPLIFEEKLAYDVLEGKISRLDSRLKLINNYLSKKEYRKHNSELLALIDEFPTHQNLLNSQIKTLINLGQYNFVEELLKKSYYLNPDRFNTKWLGIMKVSNKNYRSALRFLQESTKFSVKDPQVYFNIAGIYLQNKKYDLAYENVNKCLLLDPDYKNGKLLRYKLEEIIKK